METKDQVVYIEADDISAACDAASELADDATIFVKVEARSEDFRVLIVRKGAEETRRARKYSQREIWEYQRTRLRERAAGLALKLAAIEKQLTRVDGLLKDSKK